MTFLSEIPYEYYIYAGAAILLLGIILGFTRTITVYRDFADLTKVFMLVLAPIGLFLILGNRIENKILLYVLIAIEGLLLLWILISTFIDNRNIFKTLLAFITKLPLGIIFAIYLINLVSPGGTYKVQRRRNRGVAAIILIFLGPILFGLVKNRSWSATRHNNE